MIKLDLSPVVGGWAVAVAEAVGALGAPVGVGDSGVSIALLNLLGGGGESPGGGADEDVSPLGGLGLSLSDLLFALSGPLDWVSKDSAADVGGSTAGVGGQSLRVLLLGLTLAKALWGPVGVGDSAAVVAGNSLAKAVVAPWLGGALAKALWGPLGIRHTSWVSGDAKAVAKAVVAPWLSRALANSLWRPLGVGDSSTRVSGDSPAQTIAVRGPCLGLGISRPLAQAASVAGGLESGSDDSGPAGVGLQGSGGVPGVGGGQTQKRRNSLGEKANILRYLLRSR